jgi:hypothetical protein
MQRRKGERSECYSTKKFLFLCPSRASIYGCGDTNSWKFGISNVMGVNRFFFPLKKEEVATDSKREAGK